MRTEENIGYVVSGKRAITPLTFTYWKSTKEKLEKCVTYVLS